ncbi:MAG: mevalonate kinase [Myxococcales bacterium]|nr:mevalonate kinase [Myxococcales bacterium]
MKDHIATAAAPGKVVLFGEHAVVYGRPAVAAALGRGLGATAESSDSGPVLRIPSWGRGGLTVRPHGDRREFDAVARGFAAALTAVDLPADAPVALTLDGELPLGVGLGSSAAFGVAIVRALAAWKGQPLDDAGVLAAADQVEHVFHGTPSGLDHTVVTHGGCLRYQRGATARITPILLADPLPVVVAWTPREGTTREAVARLRARVQAHPALYDRLFDAIGEVAEAGVEALVGGDLDLLGALLDLNHGYLNACGVSSPANEQMVALARRAGAVGAKLTGAGCGGAIVALTREHPERVVRALTEAGFDAFATTVGER